MQAQAELDASTADMMQQVAELKLQLQRWGQGSAASAQHLKTLLPRINATPWDKRLQVEALAHLAVLGCDKGLLTGMLQSHKRSLGRAAGASGEAAQQRAFTAAAHAEQQVSAPLALLFLAAERPQRVENLVVADASGGDAQAKLEKAAVALLGLERDNVQKAAKQQEREAAARPGGGAVQVQGREVAAQARAAPQEAQVGLVRMEVSKERSAAVGWLSWLLPRKGPRK